jgi:hypothetical protein
MCKNHLVKPLSQLRFTELLMQPDKSKSKVNSFRYLFCIYH